MVSYKPMRTVLTILTISILVVVGYIVFTESTQTIPEVVEEKTEEAASTTPEQTNQPTSYDNTDYGFSLTHPTSDWRVHEDTSQSFSPKFNVYQTATNTNASLPFNHFANETHVSVYPQGIPTEGVFGVTEPLTLSTNFATSEDSQLYRLKDGTPFAAYIIPKNPPQSWSESGFIWVRAHISNLESECLRNGAPVAASSCDPLTTDDTIVRTGSVADDDWQAVQAILNSLTLDSSGTTATLIELETPTENETITNPLTVSGQARGTWYFEATFPVVLTDWDGRIIAEGYAQAQTDWMTEDFVPFTATLNFTSPYEAGMDDFMRRGSLILQKANPSGLPEHDDALEIPIRFSE